AGERERFESLLRDRFTAALAIAEAPLVQLLKRGHHFLQQPPIAIAQLEQELAVVGRRGLISEVLDRVVVGTLAVEDVLSNFVDELTILLFQLLSEVSQAFLLHRCLLRHCISRPRLIAQATMPPTPLQSLEGLEGIIIPPRKEAARRPRDDRGRRSFASLPGTCGPRRRRSRARANHSPRYPPCDAAARREL